MIIHGDRRNALTPKAFAGSYKLKFPKACIFFNSVTIEVDLQLCATSYENHSLVIGLRLGRWPAESHRQGATTQGFT